MEKIKSFMPFAKVFRMGNFKVWRSRYNKNSEGVDCLNISTLDQAWSVRIPQTYELYAIIMMMMEDYLGEDKDAQVFAKDKLAVIFSNLLFSSTIGNGHYQYALFLLATAYANPDLLKGNSPERKAFKKSVKDLLDGFLKWRKSEDKSVMPEEDPGKEDLAEEAMNILG